MISPLELSKRMLTRQTDHIFSLPIMILMPHSRCNCRCVMCDIWKANKHGVELTVGDLRPHLQAMTQLNVQLVVLSGGEALMHSNLWLLCRELKKRDIKITLLSTGLLLAKNARNVVAWTDEIILSLDGSRDIHNRIRNVPRAFERLSDGVDAVKNINPDFRITARCVIQKMNFRDLPLLADMHK